MAADLAGTTSTNAMCRERLLRWPYVVFHARDCALVPFHSRRNCASPRATVMGLRARRTWSRHGGILNVFVPGARQYSLITRSCSDGRSSRGSGLCPLPRSWRRPHVPRRPRPTTGVGSGRLMFRRGGRSATSRPSWSCRRPIVYASTSSSAELVNVRPRRGQSLRRVVLRAGLGQS
jgi:hypothetical protein